MNVRACVVFLCFALKVSTAESQEFDPLEESWQRLASTVKQCATLDQLIASVQQVDKDHTERISKISSSLAANIALSNRDPEDYEKCFRLVTAVAILNLSKEKKLDRWPKEETIDSISSHSMNALRGLATGYPEDRHPIRIFANATPSILLERRGKYRFYELVSFRDGVRMEGVEIRGKLGEPDSFEWKKYLIPNEQKPPQGSLREIDSTKVVPCYVAARSALAVSLVDDTQCRRFLQIVVACMLMEPFRQTNDSIAIGAGMLADVAAKFEDIPHTVLNERNLRSRAAASFFVSGQLKKAQNEYRKVGMADREDSLFSLWGQAVCDIGLRTPENQSQIKILITRLDKHQDEEHRRQVLRLMLQAIEKEKDRATHVTDETRSIMAKWFTDEPDAVRRHCITAIKTLLEMGEWKAANEIALYGLESAVQAKNREHEVEFLTYLNEIARNWAYFSISWEWSSGRWTPRKERKLNEFVPAITNIQKERVAGVDTEFRYGMLTPEEDFATVHEMLNEPPEYVSLCSWARSELEAGNCKPLLKVLFFEWYHMPYEKRFRQGDFSYKPMNVGGLADPTKIDDEMRRLISGAEGSKNVFEVYEKTMLTLFSIYNPDKVGIE